MADGYALYRILETKHDERPWPDWEVALCAPRSGGHRRDRVVGRMADGPYQGGGVPLFRTVARLRDYAHVQSIVSVRRHADRHCTEVLMLHASRDPAETAIMRLPEAIAGAPPDHPPKTASSGQPAATTGTGTRPTATTAVDRLRATAELADFLPYLRLPWLRGDPANLSTKPLKRDPGNLVRRRDLRCNAGNGAPTDPSPRTWRHQRRKSRHSW